MQGLLKGCRKFRSVTERRQRLGIAMRNGSVRPHEDGSLGELVGVCTCGRISRNHQYSIRIEARGQRSEEGIRYTAHILRASLQFDGEARRRDTALYRRGR